MLHLVSHTTGIPTAALSTSPDLDGRLVAGQMARQKLILRIQATYMVKKNGYGRALRSSS